MIPSVVRGSHRPAALLLPLRLAPAPQFAPLAPFHVVGIVENNELEMAKMDNAGTTFVSRGTLDRRNDPNEKSPHFDHNLWRKHFAWTQLMTAIAGARCDADCDTVVRGPERPFRPSTGIRNEVGDTVAFRAVSQKRYFLHRDRCTGRHSPLARVKICCSD